MGSSAFSTYFKFGIDHILEFAAIDHILFIITLCVAFRISEWKKILTIITAFTIGHSITLALSSFSIINVPPRIVETAIPLTIIFTAFLNVLRKQETSNIKTFNSVLWTNYLMAIFFGMIHGMGFASSFRFLMGTNNVVVQLLAFNLGIEAAQLLVVSAFMGIYFVCIRYLRVPVRELKIFIGGAATGVSVFLLLKVWELL